MQAETQDVLRPRITVLAAGDPLAGDVAACLAGRYHVESAIDSRSAARCVAAGTRALIIMAADKPVATDVAQLIRQAVNARCRVLVLGPGGLGPEDVLDANVLRLPQLPSPRDLFASLAGLGPGAMSSSS